MSILSKILPGTTTSRYNELVDDYQTLYKIQQQQENEYNRILGNQNQASQEIYAAYEHNLQQLFQSDISMDQMRQSYEGSLAELQARRRPSPLMSVMARLQSRLGGTMSNDSMNNPYQNMFNRVLRGVQRTDGSVWDNVLNNEKR